MVYTEEDSVLGGEPFNKGDICEELVSTFYWIRLTYECD